MTTTISQTCPRCAAANSVMVHYEEPRCVLCGWSDYRATTAPGTPQERRRAKRRGYRIRYTGDHRNLAHLTVFVEPDRQAQYYQIRCAFDGHVMKNANISGYMGRNQGETRGSGYACSERHIVYIQRDSTNAPVSWS